MDEKTKLKYLYYDQILPVGHKFKELKFKFNNHKFRFLTDVGMFARFEIDTGTKFLLRNLDAKTDDTFLDLCCGYGVVGITAGKFCRSVVMSDVNERAIEMVKRNFGLNLVTNAKVVNSDLFENIENKFTIIATNPPLRAGMEFMKKLVVGAKEHLYDNGRIFIVARKKQNAYKIFEILGENFDAKIVEKGGGYVVMKGVKYG
ncbi:MAG: 16S rRNA methyltransferase [Candidatus Altiarchaeales archaeon HGW-Altiarchaeales-1]|nr:MAG: 16S rRNA methyltransferase [Candidatus Altiarchaeales archaeon HGW-Altiarchaeales-1]